VPKSVEYPPYPLGNGVKFQIKSRMEGNRALYWNTKIAGDQFRAFIRDNNPADTRQWWTFDSRTHTVRAFAKQTHVLSG
jgi:hypothetical protein